MHNNLSTKSRQSPVVSRDDLTGSWADQDWSAGLSAQSFPPGVVLTKWLLSLCGVLVLIYCLAVLGFVTTSPDLGLRCLLSDAHDPAQSGPIIRGVEPWMEVIGPRPKVGDRLKAIGSPAGRTSFSASEVPDGSGIDPGSSPQPVRSFSEFTHRLSELRSSRLPAGGDVMVNTELLAEYDRLPAVIEFQPVSGDGPRPRWVKVEFRSQDSGGPQRCWVLVQSLPVHEILLTFIWFSLELIVFGIAAVAFWMRPVDRQIRLFFAMSLTTCGAFVGGYHWWLIASSIWLTIPFAVCGAMLPAVVLHFFLIYPQPKEPLASDHDLTLFGLYAAPVAGTVALAMSIAYGEWLYTSGATLSSLLQQLAVIETAVFWYVMLAGAYFVASIVALVNSFFTTRNPVVLAQVRWILGAGLIATLPVGYTLYLAFADTTALGLGSATIPMFAASLLFLFAYAVAMVRYKLMLVDQVLSRGMMYYVWSAVSTTVYSLAIAGMSVAAMRLNVRLLSERPLIMAAIVVAAVVLLGWLRGRLQQFIDRRFFREKYHLDNLVQRVNQTLTQMVEPEILSSRMIASCRDVLGVDRAALYLHDSSRGVSILAAAEGCESLPATLPTAVDPSTPPGGTEPVVPVSVSRSGIAPAADWLREQRFDLVHGLELSGAPMGILLLGSKRTGADFTAEDLAFLASLGQITTVALHSVRVHQDLNHLNTELQHKIEKISQQQQTIAMLQSEITSQHTLASESRPRLETDDAARSISAPDTLEPLQRELIKGRSAPIRAVIETLRKVSGSHSSVLIRGESGTGKELLARSIHVNSPRRNGPLVCVHCGALSSSLLESELFGHVKGAFTGADRDRVGRFEMATGGTLFLDEIGDISAETQVKLLRVLQERVFEPVGSGRSIRVDVRVIAATHRNLEEMIAQGEFREDLFYRLNVIGMTLPPLRERLEDVIELGLYFLAQNSERTGKRVTHIEDDALQALLTYRWPGNIRELENVIERAVVLTDESAIRLSDLPATVVTAYLNRTTMGRSSAERGRLISGQNPAENGRSQSGPRDRFITAKPRRDKLPRINVPGINRSGPGANRSSSSGRIVEEQTNAESLAASRTATETATTEASVIDERNQLRSALERCGGNKAEAARLLGVPRSTLFSKLKKHGLS